MEFCVASKFFQHLNIIRFIIKFGLFAMIGAWCVTHDDESDRVNARFFFHFLFPFVERTLYTISPLRAADM